MQTLTLSTRRAAGLVLALALLISAMTLSLTSGTAHAAEVNLESFRNNTGIAHDPFSEADFDGHGFSYSALALRLEGLAPGATVTAAGMDYTWPDTASGEPDNVGARGQVIPVDAPAGTERLGFLAAATNGPITAEFGLNYEYVDAEGVTQTKTVPARLTFSDWTLNAGGSAPSFNNTIVATTPFRMAGSTQPELVDTHVFATSANVDPTMTLTSVTLPDTSGKIHLFAMSVN